VQGVMLVFDEMTGTPAATFDAAALTRWRTAATSLLAARYLARSSSTVMVMAGAGAMAKYLIAAYRSEFPLEEIWIWSRTAARAQELAASIQIGGERVHATTKLDGAVARADIVSCATLAEDGLIRWSWVKAGTHIDLVGAFNPSRRESDDDLVRRAQIHVDSRVGALKEAGDIIQALASGAISTDNIRGDLAALVRGIPQCGRHDETAITLFKSVGHSIEDLAAAELLRSRI